ncbi:hypothetical protein, partial [Acinetobacter baumannii]|uniref:hypothetical protein n=1 Tax=Acinetobacter baumannii TaxID=470 RepID=UPI001BB46DF9
GAKLSSVLLGFDFPVIDTGVTQPWQAAVSSMIVLYMIAALFNLRIPRTDAVLQPMSGNLMELLRDFWQCNSRLW